MVENLAVETVKISKISEQRGKKFKKISAKAGVIKQKHCISHKTKIFFVSGK